MTSLINLFQLEYLIIIPKSRRWKMNLQGKLYGYYACVALNMLANINLCLTRASSRDWRSEGDAE